MDMMALAKPTKEEIEAALREMMTAQAGMTNRTTSDDPSKRLKQAGIPKRYRGCTFSRMSGSAAVEAFERAKRYAAHFGKYEKKGTGLLLLGPVGAMKTSLAVAVMQEVMQQGRSAYFVPLAELFDTLVTLSKQRDHEEFVKCQERLKTTTLLVLDDLGTEYPNDWIRNKVDAIISYRYNEMKPTIITSNLRIGEMTDQYQARVCDRLKGSSIIIKVSTPESQRRAPEEL